MRIFRSRLFLVFAILAVGLVVWLAVARSGAKAGVARLRAEGLPTSPAEADRWYKAIPAPENLANVIADSMSSVRPTRGTNTPYTGTMEVPPHPVDPDLLAKWSPGITNLPGLFASFEENRGRTASRHAVNFRNGFNTMLPHLSQLKGMAQFFALAALVHAESGRGHEAVADIRDILMVARSLDSEPTVISQLVRNACLHIAVGAAGTSLPRTTVDADTWKLLQSEFARAEATNGTFVGLAGETAMALGFFESSPTDMSSQYGLVTGNGNIVSGSNLGPKLAMLLYAGTGVRSLDESFALDCYRDLREASRMPFPAALKAAEVVDQRITAQRTRFAGGLKVVSGMLLPSIAGTIKKQAETVAELRAAIVGCAIERHRLAHGGKLPETLDALVPALLDAVPLDPFDGKPLRYIHPDGDTYTVYSIGTDLVDDLGAAQITTKGKKRRDTVDIGFRVRDRTR